MLKVKFTKDYSQTGNKAGDEISIKNLNPNLKNVVEVISGTDETQRLGRRDDSGQLLPSEQNPTSPNAPIVTGQVLNDEPPERFDSDKVSSISIPAPDQGNVLKSPNPPQPPKRR